MDHDLLVVLNGFGPEAAAAAREAATRAEADTWATTRPVQDLEAYRQAVARHPADAYCFANSYARPLAPRWMAKLLAAAGDGLAGATGSFETQRVPFPAAADGLSPAKKVLKQFEAAGPAVRTRLAFPAFPNPHLRTNAFALTHRTLQRLNWLVVHDKRDALAVESGRRSLGRQAGRVVLVDVDGNPVEPADWPGARIFRSGEQERLLVADNRTDQYAEASPEERAWLRGLAWGPGAVAG
jgi:hypothetical protein